MPTTFTYKRKGQSGGGRARKHVRFTYSPVSSTIRRRRPRRLNVARAAYSKSRIRKGKTMAAVLNAVAENKVLAITSRDEDAPAHTHSGSSAFYAAYVLPETKPAAWSAGFVPLTAVTIPQGDTASTRTGREVYLKKTHMNMFIQMSMSTVAKPPIQFRVIVFKAKRAVNPNGITTDPSVSLFLGTNGGDIGPNTSGMKPIDQMMSMTNKNEYFIKSDRKFTLSHPLRTDSDGGNAGYSGKYPTMKKLMVNFPYYKKTRFFPASASTNANQPEDLDAYWGVYILAVNTSDTSQNADAWTVSIRGTTSFSDL